MTVDTLQAVVDHATANRRCDDCRSTTQVVHDPDELHCTNPRCGWSTSLVPTVTFTDAEQAAENAAVA